MIKSLIISFLILLNLKGLAQDDSAFFKEYMKKGDSIFIKLKSGDTSVCFKKAMDAYNTGVLIYPVLADAARDSMMEVFTYIEKVKNDAIVQRIRANTATEQARK